MSAVLFDVPVSALTKKKSAPAKKKQDKLAERGCEFCPTNDKRGIQKIKGKVRGRSIALFAQSPGVDENDEGRELVGVSGQLLWRELKRVGIRRKDTDVQNVVRCLPAEWVDGYHGEYLKMRNPSKEELHCCSLYTDRATKKLEAKQILLFGQIAAKAFLKVRSLPAQKTFWSEELKAKIYILDHPSFFVRGGQSGTRFKGWQQLMQSVADDRAKFASGNDGEVADPYWHIRQQDYRAITTLREAQAARKILRKYARKKRRSSVDIESAPDGALECCGFGPKPGLSLVFITAERPDLPNGQPKAVFKVLKEILEDDWYQKGLHFGCSDEEVLQKAGIRIAGFTHDTYFSEYLRYSDLPAYGLDVVAERRYPEFAGYHNIIASEMLVGVPDVPQKILDGTDAEKYAYVEKTKLFDIRKLATRTLVLYNGADCHVTKLVEVDNKKHVPQALMDLYIDLGTLLRRMEPRGPIFDYEQLEKLELIFPHKKLALERKARRMVRKETRWYKYHNKFNPGSPEQILEVLFNRKTGFGMDYPFAGDRKRGKPNTQKMTMLTLAREHAFPRVVLDFRSASRGKSTLESYRRSANKYDGRLRTRWKATGTRTGRLSSGGEKTKKDSTIVNLQNIKKDPQIQNLCVADPRWRTVYAKIGQILERKAPDVLKYWDACAAGEKLAKSKGELWKVPKMSRRAGRQFVRAADAIAAWLAKHMPDFKVYVIADYGQVEVRVAAQMSGDKNLLADCKGGDIHTTVGTVMTGWDAAKIKYDDLIRTLTKNVHFGILFGLAKAGLFAFVSAMTPPDMREAILTRFATEFPDREPEEVWKEQMEEAYDKYFHRYRKIKKMIERLREFAREHKYVETLFGMIQTLNVTDDDGQDFEVDEEGGARTAYWGNQAINGPVQGTAHQLMICALVNLIRKATKYAMLGIPPMEVHDALYFAINVLELGEGCKKIKYLLEQESLNTVAKDFPDIDWKVPIVVEMKAGVRLGGKVSVDEKTTPGAFLLDWFRLCRSQEQKLDAELVEYAGAVALAA